MTKKPKPMPDFASYVERDDWFRDNADYYTVVRKDGVGRYERSEYKKLADAEQAAQALVPVTKGRYLIYAVVGEQSAFVKGVG
jgi:hypothetical protein